MLDLVEIPHQLIVGQRSVINDQQAVESRPQLAHVATHPNMRATLHRATDTRTNDVANDVTQYEPNDVTECGLVETPTGL